MFCSKFFCRFGITATICILPGSLDDGSDAGQRGVIGQEVGDENEEREEAVSAT